MSKITWLELPHLLQDNHTLLSWSLKPSVFQAPDQNILKDHFLAALGPKPTCASVCFLLGMTFLGYSSQNLSFEYFCLFRGGGGIKKKLEIKKQKKQKEKYQKKKLVWRLKKKSDRVLWVCLIDQIKVINVGLFITHPWPPVSPSFPPGFTIQAGRIWCFA